MAGTDMKLGGKLKTENRKLELEMKLVRKQMGTWLLRNPNGAGGCSSIPIDV